MSSKECEEQLNSLIEHFNNSGLDFNATDIEAIKHLLLENTMQHNQINYLKEQLQQSDEIIENAIEKLSFIDDTLEKDILNVPLCITKINKAIDILSKYKNEEKKNVKDEKYI